MKEFNSVKQIILKCLVCLIFLLLLSQFCFAQFNARNEIKIPNIPGYVTLKCDFHMHTVFSDGNVWPSVRVQEAWREGFDAIAITDHVEYQPHKKDVPTNHNRSYELARGAANAADIILIRAAEITRKMPPGHLNAIYLEDADQLDREDYREAIKNAVDQGGFIFWNHPGWRSQQPDGIARWYEDHTELYENGRLQGIEVVNGSSYYPEVHAWCLEKKLTLIGNSDVHGPTNFQFDFKNGDHRSMTLAFVKERNKKALKEALLARRTAVYYKNILIGEEKYLKPIFENSIKIKKSDIKIKGKGGVNLQIFNRSEVPLQLVAQREFEEISIPKSITLYGDKTVLFNIKGKLENLSTKKTFALPYKVKNFWIAPEESLPIELKVKIEFSPAEQE